MSGLDPALTGLLTYAPPSFIEEVTRSLKSVSDPDIAVINLERWLASLSNPNAYVGPLQASPDRLTLLLEVLGASQPLADSLIQNPEFGALFLDPQESEALVSVDEIVRQGDVLLRSSIGPSHALDRIRYLRQRRNLMICMNDLDEVCTQEQIWKALSDLADAVIALTMHLTWAQFRQGKELPNEPPIAVVAFGKLGARELNYSSDIDLAYVLSDSADERLEKECTKFCAQFGRALSDRMGRGALYRVDLRLRPYGSQGPILARAAAFDNYYRLYAETWEIQALIKSRIVSGEATCPGWSAMKEVRAFAGQVSDASLDELLKTRERIEEHSTPDDIKRGPGGIRDIEFLCQILQLVYGHTRPRIRVAPTCDALRAMADEQLLESSTAAILIQAYVFLRKLEHRIQLMGDRQTHELPTQPETLTKLAALMGFDRSAIFRASLNVHRRSVRSIYRALLVREDGSEGVRERLAREFEPQTALFLQWFDGLPESESYYESLESNPDSRYRVKQILRFGPELVVHFKTNLSLTDAVLADELDAIALDDNRWANLPSDASPRQVADCYANQVVAIESSWLFDSKVSVEATLQEAADGLLSYCLGRFDAAFDVIALGSYGSGSQSGCSDLDVLFLSRSDQPLSEKQAQDILGFLVELRRFGKAPRLDLRLRPDGRKGLLVRSFQGFAAYEAGDMEMWERFALGHARMVSGSREALNLVLAAAYGRPLGRSALAELLAIKDRIELERVPEELRTRQVKLGSGGLNDLEWAVHLFELANPVLPSVPSEPAMEDRIRTLGKREIVNAFEVESLILARRHLMDLRNRIYLAGFPQDILPEDLGRLGSLAEGFGLADGNELLRVHDPIAAWVRGFFQETISRLSQ